MRAFAATAALAAAVVGPARADPFDEFGHGARAAGLGGAYTAVAEGVDAAHHNPAAVALAEHPAILIGYGYGAMQLSLNGRDADVLDARGISLGLAIPLRWDDATVAFGLALYMPDQFVARVQTIPATEPHFGLLDNDPHRVVVDPVLAVSVGDKLAIGAGVSLFTNVAGNGIAFDVGVVSGEKLGQAALDVEMPTRAAPLVGVLARPAPNVRIGASYRAALGLDVALDILANVDVANVVTGDALVSLRASNYYTPQRAALGVAIDPMDDLTLTVDGHWTDWSEHPGLVADLRILINLDTAPPLVQSDVPEANFADTLSMRAGAEARFGTERTRFAVRAGYAYTPSPVPDQTGVTSIADNDRHLLALGFGVTLADWRPLLTRPIAFGIAAQWHHLSDRLTVKDAMEFPVGAFSSGGDIIYAGTTMTVDF